MNTQLEQLKKKIEAEFKEHLGVIDTDTQLEIANISYNQAGLLQLALTGKDVSRDMLHTKARFASFLAKRQVLAENQAREIYNSVMNTVVEIGSKALVTSIKKALED